MLQRLQTTALLLLSLCLLAGSAWAGLPNLQLDQQKLQQPVAVEQLQLLEDPSASLDAVQALQQMQLHGQTNSGAPHLGYSASSWQAWG